MTKEQKSKQDKNVPKYYNGNRLLSMQDINNNRPEIYLCSGNRTGGKTTWFSQFIMNQFIRKQSKFLLLYRFNYELADTSNKFFKDIGQLFFSEYEMRDERKARGKYVELFLCKKGEIESAEHVKETGISCGYAVAINDADILKKNSHLFSDVDRIFFDEFQSENNNYCVNEIQKFISIHTSVARGQGKQVRYVPVYMCSNAVSLINPYYTELGISERLKSDTKFLRGNGWVLEQGYVESASLAQSGSGFNKAFEKNGYIAYSKENIYLNDSQAFINQPEGRGRYVCTIKYNGSMYGVREYAKQGIIYVDNKPDRTFPIKIAVTTEDHDVNWVMLKKNETLIITLRFYFEHGCVRFKDLRSKQALLACVSY